MRQAMPAYSTVVGQALSLLGGWSLLVYGGVCTVVCGQALGWGLSCQVPSLNSRQRA